MSSSLSITCPGIRPREIPLITPKQAITLNKGVAIIELFI